MDTEFGNRLTELRLDAGFSQEKLAEELGVSRQTISKWENGEVKPDTANLVALSQLFNVTIDELVGNRPMRGKPSEEATGEVVENPIEEDDDDEDGEHHHGMSRLQQVVGSVGFVVVLVAYLILGFVWKGPTGALGWASGWVLLFLPVIITSLISAIEDRRPSHFQIVPLVVGVYCAMGIIGSAYGKDFWHPYWLEFLLIPLYYTTSGLIERGAREKN